MKVEEGKKEITQRDLYIALARERERRMWKQVESNDRSINLMYSIAQGWQIISRRMDDDHDHEEEEEEEMGEGWRRAERRKEMWRWRERRQRQEEWRGRGCRKPRQKKKKKKKKKKAPRNLLKRGS